MCGLIGMCMLQTVIQFYGSAEASSTDKPPLLPVFFRGMSQAAPATSVWKMTKVELLAECTQRGLAVNPKWTCPELRTVLTADSEYNNRTAAVPKGLSSMNLGELKAEAERLGIPMVAKETRGSLMLKVRDAVAPDSTVMTIGRFKGSTYSDIPENYASWASEEERQNGDNMSPDLKRFVLWRRHRRTSAVKGTALQRGYKDPEKNVKVPPPPLSETGSSAWAVVEASSVVNHDWRPFAPSVTSATSSQQPKATAPPTPKARATRRERSPEAKGPMDQDVDETTYAEIQELEARLAVLKDRCGVHSRQ